MTTAEALAAITDRGKFEILANAILREADPNYRALTAPGVNAKGEPIKSPVDAYCWVPGADPPRLIVAAHTTIDARGLKKKWFGGTSSGQGKANVMSGDLAAIVEQMSCVRSVTPDATCTIVLTSNGQVSAPLQDSVHQLARNNRAEADIWDQARLVHYLDHAFVGRGIRRRLLGIGERAAFVSADEFFQPWLDTKHIFNHTWTFQGRRQVIESFSAFVGSPEQNVFVLPGSGGIGKSRLLRHFAEIARTAHPEAVVCFLTSELSLNPDDFLDLPNGPVLILVDDTHARDDLDILFKRAIRHPNPIKLILACRPYGIGPLTTIAYDAGYQVGALSMQTPLRPLTEHAAEKLTKEILGTEFPHLVRPIVTATRDCPLMTVLAAKLAVERQIPAVSVTNDPDFRTQVLSHFRGALLGKLGDNVVQDQARRLLPLVAAVSPIPTMNDLFATHAADMLGWRVDEVLVYLGKLQDAGLTAERAYSFRITPDVLSDDFLQEACISRGQPTGFAEVLYDKFGDDFGPNLLRNLAQLDWRSLNSKATSSSLLDNIWERIKSDFLAATNSSRLEMLGHLKGIAAYLPKRMLELVELAIANPSQACDLTEERFGWQSSHQKVLVQLPDIIERISHHFDLLPRCHQLLWELAHDLTPQNERESNLAIDTLCKLASYRVFPDGRLHLKPNQVALEQATIKARDVCDEETAIQLLRVFEVLLVSSDETHYFDGKDIVGFSFVVPIASAREIRQSSLDQIVSLATPASEPVRFRACQALKNAFRPPESTYHNELTSEQILEWTPERLKVLHALKSLLELKPGPIVQMQIIDDLRWFENHDIDPEIRTQVASVIASIPHSDELDLVKNLARAHEPGWAPPQGVDVDYAFEAHYRELTALRQAIVTRFLGNARSPVEAALHLDGLLNRIADCGIQLIESPFFAELSRQDPTFSAAIADKAINQGMTYLTMCIRPLMCNLWKLDPVRALRTCARGIRLDNNAVLISTAQALRFAPLPSECEGRRAELVEELVSSQFEHIRIAGMEALDAVAKFDVMRANRIAFSVAVATNQQIAEAVCRYAATYYSSLTGEEVDALLLGLDDVPEISDMDVGRFVALASHQKPRQVFELLLRRVDKIVIDGTGGFRAIPHVGPCHQLAGFIKSSEHSQMLREVRDRTLHAPWLARRSYANLFRIVSSGFGDTGINVLLEWARSNECTKLSTVSCLLTTASSDTIFGEGLLVSTLLESAKAISEDCFREVTSALIDAAMGEPFPEDIELHERASAALASAEPESAAYRFYMEIMERAKRNIREAGIRRNGDDE